MKDEKWKKVEKDKDEKWNKKMKDIRVVLSAI